MLHSDLMEENFPLSLTKMAHYMYASQYREMEMVILHTGMLNLRIISKQFRLTEKHV